jgi:RNA polymerase sigma factor (sigma-70 family)
MPRKHLDSVVGHLWRAAGLSAARELTDAELLERFVAGRDEDAFAVLVCRYGRLVRSVCRQVLHHEQDVDDAFQVTFLVLASRAASVRKTTAVASWLYGVAYRTALSARRARPRRGERQGESPGCSREQPFTEAALREVQAILHDEVNALPEKYRAPFVLCCLEGKSRAEAARELGWKEGTVFCRVARARAELQRRLTRRGVVLSAALCAVELGRTGAAAAVKPALVNGTIRAALSAAAGKATSADLVSAEVAALAKGALRTMGTTRLKVATGVLLAVSFVAGAGLLTRQALAAKPADGPQAVPPKAAGVTPGAGQEQAGPAKRDEADAVVARGRVLGPDGKPFAGAKLYLHSSRPGASPYPVRATSGADGRFEFRCARSELANTVSDDRGSASGPRGGVMAAAKGYGCDWATVGEGGKEGELTLRLVQDVPIRGRILDPDGKPVAGARLTVEWVSAPRGDDLAGYIAEARQGYGIVFAKDWDGPLPEQPAVLTTGADGRFRLTGVGRERVVGFRLEGPAIASTYLGPVMTREAATIVDPKGQRTYGASFDHVALASRPVRGVVRDKATGKPLAGVSVGHYSGDWPGALTDKEGRYELLGLVKGPHYSLVVKPPDGLYFQRGVRFEDTAGLGPLSGDIELVRGLTVRGRVTDKETGKPVAGARVDYHPIGGNAYVDKLLRGSWDPRSETTTGADGSYALTVMPGPGVIGVTAPRRDAYRPAAVPLRERKDFFKTPLVDDNDEGGFTWYAGGGSYGGISLDSYNAVVLLEPGEKEEALMKDVALERPEKRQGRVVGPDGRPLRGATVIGLDAYRFTAETLEGSEFTVRGVYRKANRPLVFFHKGKNLGFYLKDLRGEAPGPLTVKLQACGSASGRVVDPNGQPVAGLRLHVPGRATLSIGEERWVTTDKEGRFRAEGLVAGQEYWVWDASGSFPRVFATVVVEPGKHKDMGDITMTERRE